MELYSARRHVKAHKSLYREDGRMQYGIEEWPLTFVDALRGEELSQKGFEIKDIDGVRCFQVTALVVMTKEADHINLTVKLLRPDHVLVYDDGDLTDASRYDVIYTATKELSDVNRSHTISNGGGSTVVPAKRKHGRASASQLGQHVARS